MISTTITKIRITKKKVFTNFLNTYQSRIFIANKEGQEIASKNFAVFCLLLQRKEIASILGKDLKRIFLPKSLLIYSWLIAFFLPLGTLLGSFLLFSLLRLFLGGCGCPIFYKFHSDHF
jgi:hypothetical protein